MIDHREQATRRAHHTARNTNMEDKLMSIEPTDFGTPDETRVAIQHYLKTAGYPVHLGSTIVEHDGDPGGFGSPGSASAS
ncbi:hypothetical protein DSM104299_00224 [Baekduia alba]|nr:hypothetical protein DSM104299_00224 [Baekduia alba]